MYIVHIVAFLKIEGFPCYFYSFADPHHLDADPDPFFHFDAVPDPTVNFGADPDLTFHFDADPDSTFALMRIRLWIRLLIKVSLLGSIVSHRSSKMGLHGSIVSSTSPSRLKWIWIRLLTLVQIHADPDSHHCLFTRIFLK
jgi:hypothetical protein